MIIITNMFETYRLACLFIAIMTTQPTLGQHYEKFFEVDGGPEYMYYFSKFYIGTPAVEQSAIIDTGSDTLAFPCDHCEGNDCGTHQDPRFHSSKSKTFGFDISCSYKMSYHNHQVCQFVKSYAEGSSLLGFLAEDYIKFKDSRRVNDYKLAKLNAMLKKDLKMKAEFGCTTKETGLFKTQYADGILGLDNDSSLIESLQTKNSKHEAKVFSFGLCFHNTGGIMSVDLRNLKGADDKTTMLTKQLNDYKNPLIIPYNDDSSYYEVTVSHFSIFKGGKVYNEIKNLEPIRMMVDSGTTFSHFPQQYISRILEELNSYCKGDPKRCGQIPNARFNEDSCLELRQPDENYKNERELLRTFPDIRIHISGSRQAYVLLPKNYFYKEYLDDGPQRGKGIVRLCMALKSQDEEKIILGAFSMIDHYFYFDRKSKQLKIFKENCYLRTAELLKKKERLLQEVIVNLPMHPGVRIYATAFVFIGLGLYVLTRYKGNKSRSE